MTSHWHQLDDGALLNDAVRSFASTSGFPIVFGGYETARTTTISAATGTHTGALQGLRVDAGRGLGGKAMAEQRPRLTTDYAGSLHITHDYDREVLAEGIVTLFAYPVVVAGVTRAVLYGGSRSRTEALSVFSKSVATVVDAFGREIRVRDETKRRLALLNPSQDAPRRLDGHELEALRESYAELRSISASVQDPELREKLTALEQRLATLSGVTPITAEPAAGAPKLTPRELDVVAHAALGSSNAEIATSLRLTEGTVKSYLKTACAKLEASNRHAAVAAARRAGLLP